jgi:hypothetical protein
MLQKEELQKEIEAHQELRYDSLLDEDQYLAEVNLDYLESSSGERQEYWLVAIWHSFSRVTHTHMGAAIG